MKKTAAVILLSLSLMACNRAPSGSKESSAGGNKDTTVTPATDTSANSKLKNYTAPAQEDRLRKVSADTAQKPNK